MTGIITGSINDHGKNIIADFLKTGPINWEEFAFDIINQK